MDFLATFFDNYGMLLAQGTWDTLLMTIVSTFFAYVIGIPPGRAVRAHKSERAHASSHLQHGARLDHQHRAFDPVHHLGLVALIPFTRFIVGTSLGVPGAIVPLVISAAPFIARMVEQSIEEVDGGLVEAAQSFGANTWQIVYKVFLREALPSLVRGFAIVFITILGYSAMAGCVGAGGLGDIAIRYGYQRYQDDVMIATVIILIVIVQIVQSACNFAARKMEH